MGWVHYRSLEASWEAKCPVGGTELGLGGKALMAKPQPLVVPAADLHKSQTSQGAEQKTE